MSDDDRLSNISWPECTEKDLQEIDRLCEESRRNNMESDHGAPSLVIGIEGLADWLYKSGEGSNSVDKSPYALFREKRGYLSVTDIVAPSWCEVQFDYGLRQLRNRPLKERPQSFLTSAGKEIHVKAKVAEKNAQVLDKGKSIHKDLEREIHKEEIPIEVETKEEAWALNLLNFLSRLKSIKKTSVCRELPVWGIIQEHPIFGIIDELRLETTENPGDTSPSQKRQTQTDLDSYITNARKIIQEATTNPPYILHIIDNKTRYNPHIPSHADTLPSRLQMMLYRHMLSQVLAPPSSGGSGTSFGTFCARTGADLSRRFSDAFVAEMSVLAVENELSLHFLDAKCLEDLDFPYRESVKEMGLDVEGCVSRRLSLVYRLRRRTAKRLKSGSATIPLQLPASTQRDVNRASLVPEAVAKTPEASITDGDPKAAAPMDGTVDTVASARNDSLSVDIGNPPVGTASEDEAIAGATSTSHKRKRRKSSGTAKSQTNSSMPEDVELSSTDSDSSLSSSSPQAIVGTKKFQYNEELLNTHLTSVLAWWHGKRPPHGVSIEDAGRCFSCEYRNGCEWREQKALEVLERKQL